MKLVAATKTRRSVVKSFFGAAVAAVAGAFGVSHLTLRESAASQVSSAGGQAAGGAARQVPLFSSVKVHNGLVYVAGKGEHTPGDITTHTKAVLDKIEAELVSVGSSMDKVLKANVYLADLADYDGMNDAFRGRFGDSPPVRTTVACYGGIPGDSLVEIDVIAAV